MLHYLKRARALAATVRRLEGEVQELRATLQAVELRCQTLLEGVRLEALAAERRAQVQSDQLEKAVVGVMEELRLARPEIARAAEGVPVPAWPSA